MSQYRDDRDAAKQRIAELEARLSEREAALSEQRVSLADREAEVARLRHQLILSGIVGARTRPVHAAWATRLVVLAIAVAGAALGVGILALRSPQPVIVQVAPATPILADPAVIAAPSEPEDEEPAHHEVPREEIEVRKQLEPKVWAGRASVDEIRMLKAICSHQGDRACRDRAAKELAKLLPPAKPRVF